MIKNFGTICVCAERYAIGRRTYMPDIVATFIKDNIQQISSKDIRVLINDLEYAIDRGNLGDSNIDAPIWVDLFTFLREHAGKRT